jgi:uncharacterized cupin superfamily protein
MPTIINPDSLVFKEDPNTLKEFKLKTLTPRLAEICGSKNLIFDIRQLDAGKYSFPYHFHRNAEELMMIISGSFTLRSKDGLKIINKGELVFFEIGESGVHQFYNHTSIPCIYLDIRTSFGIDITEYPDSGKINILTFREVFEKHSKVDYNRGEDHIEDIWNELRKGRKD